MKPGVRRSRRLSDSPETAIRWVGDDGTIEVWFAGEFAVRLRVPVELARFYRRLVPVDL
jgi:hypothetical protein